MPKLGKEEVSMRGRGVRDINKSSKGYLFCVMNKVAEKQLANIANTG